MDPLEFGWNFGVFPGCPIGFPRFSRVFPGFPRFSYRFSGHATPFFTSGLRDCPVHPAMLGEAT